MDSAAEHLVETPSGKGAGDENFPVGSFLLPAALRPHVATFYAYARAIDDIADNPDLAPADKVHRLEGFASAIRGEVDDPAYAKAVAMRRSLMETAVSEQHCLDLVHAFKQDAVKGRYKDWDELIDYCNHSASPVGRYLLDLHGESTKAYPYADALCNALQVINHLQDCAEDFHQLDRIYLPQNWMAEAGARDEDLSGTSAAPALLEVIHRSAEASANLMEAAKRLPAEISSIRLALESEFTVRVGSRLIVMLLRGDPVAARIELNKIQYAWCGIGGVLSVLGTR